MEILNRYSPDSEGLQRFSMDQVTVNGVQGINPGRTFSMKMFSLKSIEDPGEPFNWRPNLVVDERHWLDTGHIVPLGNACVICKIREEGP